jgi:hypothetical protein
MKAIFRRGSGVLTALKGPARLQLYWPSARWSAREKWIFMDTRVSISRDKERGYFGAGFQILGFGIGGDYERPNRELDGTPQNPK